MRRIRWACCTRAGSGHAAAPPPSAMRRSFCPIPNFVAISAIAADRRRPHAKRGARPPKSRAACNPVCKSADVHDPLLSLRLGSSRGMRRKLEYRRFLTLKHVGEHQSLPVRKF